MRAAWMKDERNYRIFGLIGKTEEGMCEFFGAESFTAGPEREL
jgi:hypothetical protein